MIKNQHPDYLLMLCGILSIAGGLLGNNNLGNSISLALGLLMFILSFINFEDDADA